ncbi:hypothetical protein [Bacillus paranthracis]|uniref:hypothetical protein n=1 Tax=Bacillus paranthracis TaxID=2026186 RepID=UPI0008FDB2B6|nr:hypothetical protein [Bacillus paranthracis]MCU5211266.1 hypothetical protein [Bacillus paranthracis]OJE22625.1 hypothetical protein BAQ46_17670 [Bacillus paranthracis]
MTNTKTAVELMHEAREIKAGTASYVRELLMSDGGVNEQIRKTGENRELSEQGKAARKGRIKRVATHVLLEEMKERRSKYNALLDEAEKQTRALLTPQFEDLSEADRILYDAEISDLKTKVLLAPNQDTAIKYLERMVDIASKKGKTAHELQGYFTGQLAELVGKGENLPHIRPLLLGMSQKLANASQVPNFDQIKEQLDYINEMRSASFAVGQVQTAIKENLGHIAERYVNEPAKYFEDHADTAALVEKKIENHERFGHDLFSE